MTNIPINFESTKKEDPSPATPVAPQSDSTHLTHDLTDEGLAATATAPFEEVGPEAASDTETTSPLLEFLSNQPAETQDLSAARPIPLETATSPLFVPQEDPTPVAEPSETAQGSEPETPEPAPPAAQASRPEPKVEKAVELVEEPPAPAKQKGGGGLSMEETVELLTNLAVLQEDLARAESQTQLARKHVEIVQEQLAKVNEEKSNWHDQLLRQRAEFENYRKRVEREKQDLLTRSRSDVIGTILEVLDNLERALNTGHESGNLQAFLEGVELIQKQLYTALVNFGLTPVPAVGEAFDPTVHEAVATQVTTEHAHNTVVEELKRGYFLGDRLLRPAMVRVAIKS